MKDQHDERISEHDNGDWRRGRYEPGEPPEAEQVLRRARQDHVVQQSEQRRTKTRQH